MNHVAIVNLDDKIRGKRIAMTAVGNGATFDKNNIKELALEVANLLREVCSNLDILVRKF